MTRRGQIPAGPAVDLQMARRIASHSDERTIDAIGALDRDTQADLVMLAWVGCGLYAARDWREARFEAYAAQNGRTACYLSAMPLLAAWLERGIAELGPVQVLRNVLH